MHFPEVFSLAGDHSEHYARGLRGLPRWMLIWSERRIDIMLPAGGIGSM